LAPQDIRLGIFAWCGRLQGGEIEVTVEGKTGLRRTGWNNVKFGRGIKAITVNYQTRSIVGDVAKAGLRDPAKTRLGRNRRSPTPAGGFNGGYKSSQIM
jgi:hypothetical protein